MPLTLLPTFARLVRAKEDEPGRIDRRRWSSAFAKDAFCLTLPSSCGLAPGWPGRVVIFFEASDEILAAASAKPDDRIQPIVPRGCSMRFRLSERQ